MSNWSIVKCQYEGGGYGQPVDILVETEDVDKASDLIRNNRDKISDFVEHSIQDEYTFSLDHPSFDYGPIHTKSDVEEILNDIFAPDYAVFKDDTVMKMKYFGHVCEL